MAGEWLTHTPAVLAQCRAEHSRLHGHPDPAGWAAAAAEWEALGQPYPAACVRWREAEALLATKASRARAEQALGAAHAVAVRLGAVPLRRELKLLAQRGRVRLEAPAEPSAATVEAPSVAASLGLTQREAEVLALVAARANQPADRPGTVHHSQDRQHPRLEDPGQARGRRPWRGGRDRPPARPRPAMIRVGRGGGSSLAW